MAETLINWQMKRNRLPLIFGEVLFDCFPNGREILGGAPFNVAWNLQALGISPLLVSRIGDDDHGHRILEKMKAWNMHTGCLQVDSSYPTGKVRIELSGGEPLFTILPEQAYDYISPPDLKSPIDPPFLYHGSLALRNEVSFNTLSRLKQDFKCPIFVDVNLRDPWWNAEKVHNLMADATWLKLNKSEMETLFPGPADPAQNCMQILDRFDNLDAVFVTSGSEGAAAWTRDDLFASVAPGTSIDIVDTIGAGDAFSSVLLTGLARGWQLTTILERAQEFASSVVGLQGAVTEDKDFYEHFTMQWDLQ
ncbi:MAG: carbohydrate kinase [Desulfobulbaceae bacterium]|nr:carbohydrate kinase [Desulfobulbaceae bacterium]